MTSYYKFSSQIRSYKSAFVSFENKKVSEIDLQTAKELWSLIQGLKLSETQSQIVTGTKTLHHLLPRLMPPIDRGYTQPFFRLHNPQFQYNQEDAFENFLRYFVMIARKVNLSGYVDRSLWATSESKLIDNAIIGYCIEHPTLRRKYNQRGRGASADHIAGCRLCQSVARS